MSYQAVSWAMYEAPMLLTDAGKPDSTARQVLSVLAEHADERGANAHPSRTRIAYATGLDERTIERAERRLERAGLIVRDGVTRTGCTRWRLNLAAKRPASEYEEMLAAAEKAKRVESERRQARRRRTGVDVSGTQNAGHAMSEPDPCIECGGSVRHGECGCPARRMPDVRHATPPEPPVEPPMNLPLGATRPPDPLRLQDPPSSGPGNENQNIPYESDQLAVVVGATTYVARNETQDPRGDDNPSADHRSGAVTIPRRPDATCPHGRSARLRRDGTPRCSDCRSPPATRQPTPRCPEGAPRAEPPAAA